jgi:uncharacterized protein YjeT (DUF2065 family)
MDLVIKIIGIVFVAIAVVYILKPGVMSRLFDFFKKGNRLYVAVPIRLGLGVVFLVGARECKQSWVIFAFGILLLISGILVLVLGPKKLRPLIEWWQRQSAVFLRAMALIVLALGVVIIISA